MNRVIIQIKASAFCLIFLLTHSTILANQLNGGGGGGGANKTRHKIAQKKLPLILLIFLR